VQKAIPVGKKNGKAMLYLLDRKKKKRGGKGGRLIIGREKKKMIPLTLFQQSRPCGKEGGEASAEKRNRA